MNGLNSIKKYLPKSLKHLLHRVHICFIRAYVQLNPYYYANKTYQQVFGKKLNIKNPKNLIEKIYWFQFNTNTKLWTLCADKFRVRSYVEQKGLGCYLNKLYGMWESVDDIDFHELPKSFVLKANNSCGQVLIVKNKSNLQIEESRKLMKSWLSSKYGYEGAQLHYTKIRQCIIAEELLDSGVNQSLIDYKIWCFNGKPECILVCYDRENAGTYKLSMYDTKWNNISHRALNSASPHFDGQDIPCPKNFEEMLSIATKLSKDFPEVRVDLYNIDGRIVFGELTFTSGYGSYTRDFYNYLGSLIELPIQHK